MNQLDQRRRRAAYRSLHRGTKEMDWLLGRYAEAHLAGMDETALAEFERLIALPDPELQGWIMTGSLGGQSEMHGLVSRIRAFHGLVDGGARGQ
jgi:antitoxin CptB